MGDMVAHVKRTCRITRENLRPDMFEMVKENIVGDHRSAGTTAIAASDCRVGVPTGRDRARAACPRGVFGRDQQDVYKRQELHYMMSSLMLGEWFE